MSVLQQTGLVAAVEIDHSAIIAAFRSFDDAVTAGVGRFAAIRVKGVADAAFALLAQNAGCAVFVFAAWTTAVTGHGIAVVAEFSHFDFSIANKCLLVRMLIGPACRTRR